MTISIGNRRKVSFSKSEIPIIATWLIFYRRAIAVIGQFLFGINSSTVMVITYSFAIASFILWRITSNKKESIKGLIVLIIMALLYSISLLLAPSDVANEYFRDYLLYCVAGSVVISFIDEYEIMIKKYCSFSVVVFLLCAPLPFVTGTFKYHDMGYFASGMVYGEWVILPCFFGLFLLYHYYQKKWAFVLEIIDLGLMVVFANRSSLLSVATFVILFDSIIMNHQGKRVIGKWFVIALLAVIAYFYLEDIIIEAQRLLGIYGISSRALTKYLALLQNSKNSELDVSYILSGRDSITKRALSYIRESPWIGIGVGTFYLQTGVPYTHNIVTDALSTFGIFGGSFVLIITIKAIIQLSKNIENKEIALLLILLLVQCFPRLFFSKTFINDVPFWMFVVFALSKSSKRGQSSIILN